MALLTLLLKKDELRRRPLIDKYDEITHPGPSEIIGYWVAFAVSRDGRLTAQRAEIYLIKEVVDKWVRGETTDFGVWLGDPDNDYEKGNPENCRFHDLNLHFRQTAEDRWVAELPEWVTPEHLLYIDSQKT